jgi:MFS family permease
VQINGRFYSSKPPNFTLLLAAEAWLTKAVTGMQVADHERFYLTLMVFLSQVLPYCLMLWLAVGFVRELTDDTRTQVYAIAALSLGCLPFGYAVTLNNHTPTAIVLFCALVLLARARARGGPTSAGVAFTIGALCGLAFTFELTSGAFAAGFIALLAWRDRRALVWALLGAAVPVIPTVVTYYVISGKLLPFYAQKDLYDYPGSYWNEPRGLDALDEPKLLYAFNALLGWKGLFSLTPVAFLAVLGMVRTIRDRGRLAGEMLVIASASFVVIVYIIATTNNYGGAAMGLRWFAQFGPLWAIAALPVAGEWLGRPRLRVVAWFALAVSCVIVVESLIGTAFKNGGWVVGLSKVLGW